MNISEDEDKGDPSKIMLERIEIDPMVDVPLNNSNDNLVRRTNSIVRRRDVHNGMGRVESGGEGGLKGLHFLNIKGKESDAWKPMEKRFNQYAVDGRLSRDNFGTCIGKLHPFLTS